MTNPNLIMIAYPCPDMLHADFAQDLSMLMLKSVCVGKLWIGSSQHRGSIICLTRNSIVEQLRTVPSCSHMLFLDSDMRFPADTLMRLLSHGLPAVGATYCMRRPPLAMVHRDFEGTSRMDYEEPLPRVASIGMGCLLLRMDVFDAMDAQNPSAPYFKVEYNEKRIPTGEDIYFCKRLHDAGIPLHVDMPLSRLVRHVGTYEYGPNDVQKVYDGTQSEFEFITNLKREEIPT